MFTGNLSIFAVLAFSFLKLFIPDHMGLFIIISICLANLPFINQRLFSIFTLPKQQRKPLWLRLLEMVVLYIVLSGLAYFIEKYIGNIAEKNWQLYLITICLFFVFAFPGFVYQYLLRKYPT